MKHRLAHYLAALLLFTLIPPLPAAERGIGEFPVITGASINTATDTLLVRDDSAANPQGRQITFAELWKALGGTNVSASELSYLDGVTSGIQTQIGTKAAIATPSPVLVLADTFDRADSYTLGSDYLGSPWINPASPADSEAKIKNGELTVSPAEASAGEARAYPQVDVLTRPAVFGAEFRWRPGNAPRPIAGSPDAAVVLLGKPNTGTNFASSIHFVITRYGWDFQIETAGSFTFTSILTGTFNRPLPADGTPIVAAVEISGTTATIYIGQADGVLVTTSTANPDQLQKRSVTDSRIATIGGRYLCFEPYYLNGAGAEAYTETSFSAVFASSTSISDDVAKYIAAARHYKTASVSSVAGIAPTGTSGSLVAAKNRTEIREIVGNPSAVESALGQAYLRNFDLGSSVITATNGNSTCATTKSRLYFAGVAAVLSGEYVRALVAEDFFASAGTSRGTYWPSRLQLGFTLAGVPYTQSKLVVSVGRQWHVATTPAALAERGIQIEFVGATVTLKVHNGTTGTSSSAVTIDTASDLRAFVLDSDGTGNVTLYSSTAGRPLRQVVAVTGGPITAGPLLGGALEIYQVATSNHTAEKNSSVQSLWGRMEAP